MSIIFVKSIELIIRIADLISFIFARRYLVLCKLSAMIIHLFYSHGDNLQSMTWKDLYDDEFPMMMSVIDILGAIPPTSVSCETTFSQMKLIKTSRRTKLSSSTLNSLLLVKLASPSISNFNPEEAIHIWMVGLYITYIDMTNTYTF